MIFREKYRKIKKKLYAVVFPFKEQFLSPPVLKHGGLLGVAFCLSVWDWTKSH